LGLNPPIWRIAALLKGDKLPNTGSIFMGTEGAMMLPHWLRLRTQRVKIMGNLDDTSKLIPKLLMAE
jgi:hypothetical protein